MSNVNRKRWVLSSAGLIMLTGGILLGCGEDGSESVTLPGPIIAAQNPNNLGGGSGVGIDPVLGAPTPIAEAPPPSGAPTIPPLPTPGAISPIQGENPTAPVPPPPLPVPVPPPADVIVEPGVVTFEAGTGIGSTQIVTITPTAAPVDGDLVVTVSTNSPGLVGLSATGAESVSIVFPRNSVAPRSIVVSRLVDELSSGGVILSVTRDDRTNAVNFPVNSIRSFVPVALEQAAAATVDVTPESVIFAAGTNVGDAQTFTITPTEAPQNGDLVLTLTSNATDVVGLSSSALQTINVVIPQGSTAPQVVTLSRRANAFTAGNAIITITRAGATTATNFPANSINRFVPVNAEQGQLASVTLDPTPIVFATGTSIGDSVEFTITPSAPPVGGNLVLRLTSNNPEVVGLSNQGLQTINVVIPEGSAAPQTVTLSRLIRAGFVSNAIIEVVQDPATTAVNYPPNSINQFVPVSLEAGDEPPLFEPEVPVQIVTIDQITLTAENFLLTQTDSTGVVGFGPTFGPSGNELSPRFAEPTGIPKPFPPECVGPVIGVPPFLVTNEEAGVGVFTFTNPDLINPEAQESNPITLAGQRLSIIQRTDGTLVADISPANQDEVYRINFFRPESIDFRIAQCVQTTTPGEGEGSPPVTDRNLEFSDTTEIVEGVLRSSLRLFTLRGTAGGVDEPDQTAGGRLFGTRLSSDRPLAQGLVEIDDPRFSGVQNVLDVSSNQIRTDVTIIFDQILNRPTQAAIRDQRPPQQNIDQTPTNPASGSIPNTNAPGLIGRGNPTCPATATNGLVCGRFQFNQPFSETQIPGTETDLPDVLVIEGTFVGRLQE